MLGTTRYNTEFWDLLNILDIRLISYKITTSIIYQMPFRVQGGFEFSSFSSSSSLHWFFRNYKCNLAEFVSNLLLGF